VKLIEQAIASETGSDIQQIVNHVIVLDDVTPRYQNAKAALNTCSAGLGVTLELLPDTKTARPRQNEAAGRHLRVVR